MKTLLKWKPLHWFEQWIDYEVRTHLNACIFWFKSFFAFLNKGISLGTNSPYITLFVKYPCFICSVLTTLICDFLFG